MENSRRIIVGRRAVRINKGANIINEFTARKMNRIALIHNKSEILSI